MTLPKRDFFTGADWDRVAKYVVLSDTVRDCESSIGRWFGIGPMTEHLVDGVGYGAAAVFDRSYKGANLRTPALAPALNAYQRNMQRVDSMYTMPLVLIYWTTRTTKNACAAAAELDLPILEALSPDLEDNARFQAEKYKLERKESADLEEMAGGDREKIDAYIVDFSANHIQRLLLRQKVLSDSRDAFLRGGVESALFSMVLAAYAAFETFMADLWVAAVNAHPDQLAYNWLSDFGAKQSQKRLKVDLDDLRRVNFNARECMGQLLFDADGGPNFQKIEGIKSAYFNTFGPSLHACFEPFQPLWIASRVRNLVAHKGGIVDATFLSEVESFPAYSGQTAGKHLAMTGELVRDHVSACVTTSMAVVRAVDEWMVANAK